MNKFIRKYCGIKDDARYCSLTIEGRCSNKLELSYLSVQTDQGVVSVSETRLLEFLNLCNRCGWTVTVGTEFDYIQNVADRVGRFHISVNNIGEDDLSALQRFRENIFGD